MAGPTMRVLTREGVVDVPVPSEEDRSVLGSYWNAVREYLESGDTKPLEPFEGERVELELETDPKVIEHYANEGELDIDDIYGSGS